MLGGTLAECIPARATLGLINAFALIRFKDAIDIAYGKTAGRWYVAFQASQFHVMFYASRTLPNMFAFALSKFIPHPVNPPLAHYLQLPKPCVV